MEEMKEAVTEEAVAEKEIKFENRYTRTEADYKERLAALLLYSPRKIVGYVFDALFCIGAIAVVYFLGYWSTMAIVGAIVVMAFTIIGLIIDFYTYSRTLKDIISVERELNGGVLPEIDIKITEDELLFDSTVMELRTIKKLDVTKNYIYVTSAADNENIIIKKDAFTVGDAESFLPFMSAWINKPAPVVKETVENKAEKEKTATAYMRSRSSLRRVKQ